MIWRGARKILDTGTVPAVRFCYMLHDDAGPCPRCGTTVRIGDWPFCPHGPARQPKPIIWGKLGPGYRVLSDADAYRATGSELEYSLRHAPPSASTPR